MQYQIEALTVRVERLEHTNRLMKLVMVAVLLLVFGLLSMGYSAKPRTVEAEKIVILDANGHARITLGTPQVAGVAMLMKQDEPAIWLSNEKGTDRAILSSDGLYFANNRGKPLLVLESDPQIAGLKFYGADGKISRSVP